MAPAVESDVDSVPVAEVGRELSPGDAVLDAVEDGFEESAGVFGGDSEVPLGAGQFQRLDFAPLIVAEHSVVGSAVGFPVGSIFFHSSKISNFHFENTP